MNDISSIAKQLGSRGGTATKNKYGNDHFRELSKRSAKVRKEKAAQRKMLVDKRAVA